MNAGLIEGTVLEGGVELERQLGAGGFCSVWRAFDIDTRAPRAVKILHSRHNDNFVAIERFHLEAEVLRLLEHPAIPQAFGDHTYASPPHIVLEYVDGETLETRLDKRCRSRSPIPLRGISWICKNIASVLTHAHGLGIIHRDLKPANIMVNAPGRHPFVKVLDFGAAKLKGSRLDPTTVGRTIGSIAYMAPEQLRSGRISAATDQFALGVILYELLTLTRAWAKDDSGVALPFGEPLFKHESHFDIMSRIIRGPRPRAKDARASLPSSVDDVLATALAPEPRDRFASVAELSEEFHLAVIGARTYPPTAVLEETAEGSLAGIRIDEAPTPRSTVFEETMALPKTLDAEPTPIPEDELPALPDEAFVPIVPYDGSDAPHEDNSSNEALAIHEPELLSETENDPWTREFSVLSESSLESVPGPGETEIPSRELGEADDESPPASSWATNSEPHRSTEPGEDGPRSTPSEPRGEPHRPRTTNAAPDLELRRQLLKRAATTAVDLEGARADDHEEDTLSSNIEI